MTEHRPPAQQLQELETYIESLVDSLQRNELPIGLKPVRQVVDPILMQALPQLEIPAPKFIELYNDIPAIFNAYAITVNLSATSYQNRDYQQAIFDRQPQGNYWIVMTQTDRGWLVPNPAKNIAPLNSLGFAFDALATGGEGVLQLPALVQLLPTNPTTWQVTQRGQIGPANSRVTNSRVMSSGADHTDLANEVRQLRRELQNAVKSLQTKDEETTHRLNDFKAALQSAIATLKGKDKSLDERMDGFKAALQGLIQKQGK
jgi:chaperonin cofactor prefoldin